MAEGEEEEEEEERTKEYQWNSFWKFASPMLSGAEASGFKRFEP